MLLGAICSRGSRSTSKYKLKPKFAAGFTRGPPFSFGRLKGLKFDDTRAWMCKWHRVVNWRLTAPQVGNYKLARALLEEEADSNGSSLSVWVKLSALRKGAGDLSGALVAAERSLAIAPLDFTSLLQRAVLLDQLGDARSGEAFGQALSQAPQAADVPPPMRDALAHARVRWDQHSIAIEQRLKGTIPSTLDDEARSRAERFASNRARRTRHFHQEPTEFHYPGVPEIEFHDASKFPRLARLEAATEAISLEFDALLRAEVAEMIPYIQYPDHVPLAQWKELNNSRQWTAIHLLQNGERVNQMRDIVRIPWRFWQCSISLEFAAPRQTPCFPCLRPALGFPRTQGSRIRGSCAICR